MYELKNDPFFEVMARYPACCVEYFLVKSEEPYAGETSHREALRLAMEKAASEDGLEYSIERAGAEPMDASALLALPDKPWREERVFKGLRVTALHVESEGGDIPYWNAFLEPPHGSGYGPGDFRAVNTALFPEGTAALRVFRWSTDWSEYFDDGREWWGAGCWTVYDPALDRFAVILASATD